MTASESREAAIRSFDRFLSHLATIPDPRRAEGKLYQLPHVLLFSILAIGPAPIRTGAFAPSSRRTGDG
jgi:hypothetical protein